jgi:mono/diheme cytochrome c family protein
VKRAVLFLLALTLVMSASACGGEEEAEPLPETVEGTLPQETGGAAGEGDPAAGEEVYASAGCGGCHTFEAAGSSGSIGPNLDDSDIDFEAAVSQIANGGGGMPAFKDRLSEQDINDVAAFVTQ